MRFVAVLLVGLLTLACTPAQPTNEAAGALVAVDDGWRSSSLEAEGLNAAAMVEVTEFIREDAHGDFRSLIVARSGRLVFERYFNGHGRDSLHDIRSATKSLTSAVVGIAIAEGLMVVAVQSAAYNTSYGQRRSLDVLRRVLAAVE
ncbi:MAG: serine hydrolase [Luteitalea sp.]|nr:serine hydrolase [Luteitalea sp.]